MASPVHDKLAMYAEYGHDAIVLQGGMSAAACAPQLIVSLTPRLTTACSSSVPTPFIGEGFDAPALDTLFPAAPLPSLPGYRTLGFTKV
jgi:hypothetical protein